MVQLNLEEFDENELMLSVNDSDIMREYDGMDPLNFILFSMRHPGEYPRAGRYIQICDDGFKAEVIKLLNFRHGYKWN